MVKDGSGTEPLSDFLEFDQWNIHALSLSKQQAPIQQRASEPSCIDGCVMNEYIGPIILFNEAKSFFSSNHFTVQFAIVSPCSENIIMVPNFGLPQ
jgi:hypothetical protein